MNRIEDYSKLKDRIVEWLNYYVDSNNINIIIINMVILLITQIRSYSQK